MMRSFLGDQNLRTEQGQINLQYYILKENVNSKNKKYGIQIISQSSGQADTFELSNVFNSYRYCKDIIMKLKEHAVTPVTAKDVLADMLASKVISNYGFQPNAEIS